MADCTQADILMLLDEFILIQLTDDSDVGSADSDIVTRAIQDADAEIDSYCGTRYDVPFASATAIIRKLSVDIAIYNLFLRRQSAPDERKERYDNAIRFLKDVSRGNASLGENEPAADDDDGPKASKSSSDRIYTSETLENY
ncbi:MAG: DUF1320 domain-containing protein [bacterium]